MNIPALAQRINTVPGAHRNGAWGGGGTALSGSELGGTETIRRRSYHGVSRCQPGVVAANWAFCGRAVGGQFDVQKGKCEVDRRSVKRARAKLREIGWLVRIESKTGNYARRRATRTRRSVSSSAPTAAFRLARSRQKPLQNCKIFPVDTAI
jgi:hypothetical protein